MITKEALKIEELAAQATAGGFGAQALFVGVVRDNHEKQVVTAVTYDAFPPLAEKILAVIISEAEARFEGRVVAAHRLGTLKVGEASVAIAAASPHREEAFASCRYVIEEIKKRLPIWKQEHYPDGQNRWLEGCSLEHSG